MFRLASLARRTGAPPQTREGSLEPIREEDIVEVLRTVYDPEIPVNIYDLGLIYGIDRGESGDVHIRMTLTAPACPVAGTMPGMVEDAVRQLEGVGDVAVELVWDPPWSVERMSDEARLALNMYD